MGNDREIVGDKRGLAEALLSIVDGLDVLRLIDRDDRSEEDIADLRSNSIRVLSWRNLESYLFHDEVLKALAASEEKTDKIEELLKKKQCICKTSFDTPHDNLKPVSGQIYVECKRILDLSGCGNDAKTFMRRHTRPSR